MRKKKISLFVLLLIIATSFVSNDGFEQTRWVDMAQLVAFGLLLGIFVSTLRQESGQR